MKIKIITAIIIAILIMLLASISFAASGTVEFKPSTTEVKKGDTFTVTLSATSEDGINGIDTKYTYDSEKLELVNEKVVDTSNWSNMGTSPDITIICNSTQSIKNADIYILTFKVKDNVTSGSSIKVETTKILLDTDAQTDSEVEIPSKKIEITVKEVPKDNPNQEEPKDNPNQEEHKDNPNQEEPKDNPNQEEPEDNPNPSNKPSNESENNNSKTTTESDPDKSDSTTVIGRLPQTGKNYVMITIFIIIAIVLSVVFYKKYMQHKEIK